MKALIIIMDVHVTDYFFTWKIGLVSATMATPDYATWVKKMKIDLDLTKLLPLFRWLPFR